MSPQDDRPPNRMVKCCKCYALVLAQDFEQHQDWHAENGEFPGPAMELNR